MKQTCRSVPLPMLILSALTLLGQPDQAGADVAGSIRSVRAVGAEGEGNAAASAAWKELAEAGPGALTAILSGMDDSNDLALNWLRAAVSRRIRIRI